MNMLRLTSPKLRIPDSLVLDKYVQDPLGFLKACWPGLVIYDKQQEILESLVDVPEVYVHAANTVGKDFTASLAVVWFFCTRSPCRVVVTSSSETQLYAILWSEIKQKIRTSAVDFNLEILDQVIYRRTPTGQRDPQSFILAQVTKAPERFQGYHLPQDIPRTLAVFDEASGIGDEFNEAASSWAHRKLVIGNPLRSSGFFYAACKRGSVPDPRDGKLLIKVIHISGEDSPNVVFARELEKLGFTGPFPLLIPGLLSYEEFKLREQWDDVRRETRLYGRFWEGERVHLFPQSWLLHAQERARALSGVRRSPKALGLDTGEGRDFTVWTLVDDLGVVEQISLKTPDTAVIPGKTLELMKRYNIPPEMVVIDRGGGGKQHADRLRALGYAVRTVAFGESAQVPDRVGRLSRVQKQLLRERSVYKNRRSEMYARLRELLDPNGAAWAIPSQYVELLRQLAEIPLTYDDEGRLVLPPKDGEKNSLRALLGRSPDEADSLVLAAWALQRKVKKGVLI